MSSEYKDFWDDYIEFLVPPVLSVFEDEHPRVRYYACEAMYNIIKVAKPMRYFNEIFDGTGRHTADPDKDVKAGAVYLDKVLKDVVTDADAVGKHGFRTVFLPRFMPLLSERIQSKNPFLLSFLLGWVQLLQTLPDLDLYPYLPSLLPGLFGMLGENVKDLRVKADFCLANFLKGLRSSFSTSPGAMNFFGQGVESPLLSPQLQLGSQDLRRVRHRVVHTTTPILVDIVRNIHGEMRRNPGANTIAQTRTWSSQLTAALGWLQSFVEFATNELEEQRSAGIARGFSATAADVDPAVPSSQQQQQQQLLLEVEAELFAPAPLSAPDDPEPFSLLPLFLTAVLPCLDSNDRDTARIAVETHSELLQLVDTSEYGRDMKRPLLLALIRSLQKEMSLWRSQLSHSQLLHESVMQKWQK